MKIISATYLSGTTDYKKCPKPDKPEYAFIGRSNVGKSSLINMICGIKGLAKTSATPGKTQIINHFLINDSWYLVDLPGYGFAKAPKSTKKNWLKMINDYLLYRPNLMNTFVLVDVRIPPQESDVNFVNWLGEKGLPFTIVFTKCDKVSGVQADKSMISLKTILSETWESFPQMIFSSAKDFRGKEEILKIIEESNRCFVKEKKH